MEWTGNRPYIMLNPRTVKVSDPFAVESRKLSSDMKKARKKEAWDLMTELEAKQIRNDWEASAYWSDELKSFYMPDTQVLNVLKAGMGRKGKDIDRGCVVLSDMSDDTGSICIPIDTGKRFRSLEEAFKDKTYRLECPCRIPPRTGALIWKARCMMPTGWKIKFVLEYDDEMIAEKSLIDAAKTGGRIIGVGAWRPKFGRFIVTAVETAKPAE